MAQQQPHEQVEALETTADIEKERQEYLAESHLQSTQFGVGRWLDESSDD